MTNDALLHKWVEQTITPEELAIFKARPEFQQLTELYARTADLKAPAFDQKSMLAEILGSPKAATDENSEQSNKERRLAKPNAGLRGRRYWLQLAAAACVLLVPAYFLLSASNSFEKELMAGEMELGVLPDLSTYAMTGPATLSYKKRIGGQREVELQGKAEFKVQKGAPFIVTTPTGKVEVLGTVFEVFSADGELTVSCSHGKVSVSAPSPSGYKEILIADESMRLTRDGAAYTWKLNNTKLKDVSLAQVQDELSKRYELEFLTDNIDVSERLSCNFAHDNLILALKTTLAPLGLKYSQSGKTITVTK